MTIKVLFIDKNGASFIDVENSAKAFNELLGWDDFWNTPSVKVWGNTYIIVCSDTGKMTHKPISAMTLDNFIGDDDFIKEPFIVDSIILTKFDGTDDFTDLSQDDIEKLRTRLYKIPIHLRNDNFFNTILLLD